MTTIRTNCEISDCDGNAHGTCYCHKDQCILYKMYKRGEVVAMSRCINVLESCRDIDATIQHLNKLKGDDMK